MGVSLPSRCISLSLSLSHYSSLSLSLYSPHRRRGATNISLKPQVAKDMSAYQTNRQQDSHSRGGRGDGMDSGGGLHTQTVGIPGTTQFVGGKVNLKSKYLAC